MPLAPASDLVGAGMPAKETYGQTSIRIQKENLEKQRLQQIQAERQRDISRQEYVKAKQNVAEQPKTSVIQLTEGGIEYTPRTVTEAAPASFTTNAQRVLNEQDAQRQAQEMARKQAIYDQSKQATTDANSDEADRRMGASTGVRGEAQLRRAIQGLTEQDRNNTAARERDIATPRPARLPEPVNPTPDLPVELQDAPAMPTIPPGAASDLWTPPESPVNSMTDAEQYLRYLDQQKRTSAPTPPAPSILTPTPKGQWDLLAPEPTPYDAPLSAADLYQQNQIRQAIPQATPTPASTPPPSPFVPLSQNWKPEGKTTGPSPRDLDAMLKMAQIEALKSKTQAENPQNTVDKINADAATQAVKDRQFAERPDVNAITTAINTAFNADTIGRAGFVGTDSYTDKAKNAFSLSEDIARILDNMTPQERNDFWQSSLRPGSPAYDARRNIQWLIDQQAGTSAPWTRERLGELGYGAQQHKQALQQVMDYLTGQGKAAQRYTQPAPAR
jgi:hypothetical protein